MQKWEYGYLVYSNYVKIHDEIKPEKTERIIAIKTYGNLRKRMSTYSNTEDGLRELNAILKLLGDEGWEMVNATDTVPSFDPKRRKYEKSFYFKRPK